MPKYFLSYHSDYAHRLWGQIDTSGGLDACWPWVGYVGNHGYGVLYAHRRKKWTVPRLIMVLMYGDAEIKGLETRHSCHNRACCNPDHLSLGTRQQNVDDMTHANRQSRGETNGNNSFTENDVLTICQLLDAGHSQAGLVRKYKSHAVTISDIHRGARWSWLTGRGSDRRST